MSQIEEIKTAQNSLEECFFKRMSKLEAQLQSGGPAKDTVTKVAEEFRTFRELMFSMLGLLRKQINECCRMVDVIETGQRRKALIFLGIADVDKEDCKAAVLNTIHKMKLSDITETSIRACHRIGVANKDHHRPILVRFASVESRLSVWRAKSRLKGSSVSVKEFLTKARQTVFAKARLNFGIRACWTQGGIIVVKAADGSRYKITTMDELNSVTLKYPKATTLSSGGGKIITSNEGVSGLNSKSQK